VGKNEKGAKRPISRRNAQILAKRKKRKKREVESISKTTVSGEKENQDKPALCPVIGRMR